MVVRVAAKIDFQTSVVPLTAASSPETPDARRRKIFYMTTTELSSNIPTAKAIPVRVNVFIVIPAK